MPPTAGTTRPRSAADATLPAVTSPAAAAAGGTRFVGGRCEQRPRRPVNVGDAQKGETRRDRHEKSPILVDFFSSLSSPSPFSSGTSASHAPRPAPPPEPTAPLAAAPGAAAMPPAFPRTGRLEQQPSANALLLGELLLLVVVVESDAQVEVIARRSPLRRSLRCRRPKSGRQVAAKASSMCSSSESGRRRRRQPPSPRRGASSERPVTAEQPCKSTAHVAHTTLRGRPSFSLLTTG